MVGIVTDLLHLPSYASVQAAIATLYDEVVTVKNSLDNAIKERDKLRLDIQEAQKRAEVLAMEMDEQNSQHDKLKQKELQVCKQFVLHMIFTFNFQDLKQTWMEGLKSIEEKHISESETEIQGIQR